MTKYSTINNPDSSKEEKTDFIAEVVRFTSFMNYILSTIIRICFSKPLLPNDKILTNFLQNYKLLTLNLKTIVINPKTSGGKSTKRNYTKQKYTKQKSTKRNYTKQKSTKRNYTKQKYTKQKSKKYQRK